MSTTAILISLKGTPSYPACVAADGKYITAVTAYGAGSKQAEAKKAVWRAAVQATLEEAGYEEYAEYI